MGSSDATGWLLQICLHACLCSTPSQTRCVFELSRIHTMPDGNNPFCHIVLAYNTVTALAPAIKAKSQSQRTSTALALLTNKLVGNCLGRLYLSREQQRNTAESCQNCAGYQGSRHIYKQTCSLSSAGDTTWAVKRGF